MRKLTFTLIVLFAATLNGSVVSGGKSRAKR